MNLTTSPGVTTPIPPSVLTTPKLKTKPKRKRRTLVSVRRMKQMIRAVERLEAEQGALAERGHFAEVEALQPLIDRLRTQAMRTRSSDRDFVIAAIDKEGCYTETDIIAQTRLTRHTVRLALQHLIRRGIVEAYQEVRPCPGSGRRPILYRTTGVTKRSNSTKNHLDWSNSSSVVM